MVWGREAKTVFLGTEGREHGSHRYKRSKRAGTTEYAILVGVLVVIAILAIVAFRGKVTELWDAIASGINSL